MRHLVLTLTFALAAGCDEPRPSPSASGSAKLAQAPPPSVASPASVKASVAAPQAAPTEVAAQHVLVAWKGAKNAPPDVKRAKPEAKKLAEEVSDKAKRGEDFAELVKKHSDDPGSKDRLGSVGKFTRDKMTKPFADAAFGLRVDEVSAPVESDFGFHVIKRNQ